MEEKTIEKMAKVLVEVGVNVQPGQTLVLQSSTDSLPLARAVTKHAFERGAKDVQVILEDMEIKHLRAKYADADTLRRIYDWEKDRIDDYLKTGTGCQLAMMGTYPTLMEDVDSEHVKAIFAHDNDIRNVIRAYIHKGTLQWTGTCVCNLDWARKVFEGLPDDEAYAALEEDLCDMMRVNCDDPVKAWEDHSNRLSRFSKMMNDYNFKSLHITTELGTDITMDLVEGHIWESAGDMNEEIDIAPYIANMPTEEVFTDPDRRTVNGIAKASRPLMMSGKLVKNFWIRFENGMAVECGADENVEMLENALFRDEHTRQLGEVAMVSKQSVITQKNRIYYNGLIDENAASHLAFGASFPTNVKGGTSMTDQELLDHGVNLAVSHNDFMIGTPEMKVVGTTHDGREIVVFEHGDFVEAA